MTLFISGIRRRGGGTSPNGGTAGSVGDIHSVSEELSYKSRVRSLGAAGAGTGEFKQRFFVLRGDNVHNRGCLGFFSNILDAVIKYFLLIFLSFSRNHFQRVCRTNSDADAASHTIQRRYSESVFIIRFNDRFRREFSIRGSRGSLFLRKSERTDSGVRTYKGTPVAFSASLFIPLRNKNRDTAFFIRGSPLFESSVNMIHKSGNRKRISVHF